MDIVTLEYNPNQCGWHIRKPGSREPETFGWTTICDRYPERLVSAFCCLMNEQYRNGATTKEIFTAWALFAHTASVLADFRVLNADAIAALKPVAQPGRKPLAVF